MTFICLFVVLFCSLAVCVVIIRWKSYQSAYHYICHVQNHTETSSLWSQVFFGFDSFSLRSCCTFFGLIFSLLQTIFGRLYDAHYERTQYEWSDMPLAWAILNILDVILKTVLTPFDIWAEFKWQFVSYVLYIIHSDRKIPLPLAIFILMTWCASLTHLNALLARIARSYDVPMKKMSQLALISSLYTDSKWYRSDKTKVGSHTIIFPRMSESCALIFSVETRNSLGKQPKNREKNVAIRLHSAKQDVFCMLNIYNLWLRK